MDEMQEAYESAKKARGGCRKLTDGELRVVRLLSKGLKQKEVAEDLGISVKTVAAHNYNSFRKIGAKNIVEAINHVNEYYEV